MQQKRERELSQGRLWTWDRELPTCLLNRKGNPGKLAVAIIQRKVMLVVAVSQQSNLFHVPFLVHVGHTNPCPGTQLQGNNCKNTIVTIIVIIK